jgi:hypothetical protein
MYYHILMICAYYHLPVEILDSGHFHNVFLNSIGSPGNLLLFCFCSALAINTRCQFCIYSVMAGSILICERGVLGFAVSSQRWFDFGVTICSTISLQHERFFAHTSVPLYVHIVSHSHCLFTGHGFE